MSTAADHLRGPRCSTSSAAPHRRTAAAPHHMSTAPHEHRRHRARFRGVPWVDPGPGLASCAILRCRFRAPGPRRPAGRGRGPVRAPDRAGPRRRSRAGPEHIRRARCARAPGPKSGRDDAKLPWSRLADRPPIVRARSTPAKFLPCSISRHSPRPRRSARPGGGCLRSVPHFCAPPFWAGVLFCNTPLSGVPYPPIGGGIPPEGGVSALFWGI